MTIDDASEAASFSMLDGMPRQLILRSLVRLGRATTAELVEDSGVVAATVSRQLLVLEDLGIVTVDLPRGSRRGRAANISLDRARYEHALALWIGAMTR